MVVAGYDENACKYHDYQSNRITATKCKEGYGEKHRKAHRCHRHKADGEQNEDKNGKTDQSREPVDKPHTGEEGEHRLAALETVPDGKCVTEHATKECCCCAKLGFSM